MGDLIIDSVAITTTGSAGLATGSGKLQVMGHVEWIHYVYHASAPATTDVTVALADTPAGGNLHVMTNTATNARKYPRATCVDTAGAAITNSFTRIPVWGELDVSVAQCDALTAAVTVYVAYWAE